VPLSPGSSSLRRHESNRKGERKREKYYVLVCLTMKMKALRTFETSGTIYVPTRGNMPKGLDLNISAVRTSNFEGLLFTDQPDAIQAGRQ
jgi:hypothetical protein